MFRFNILHTLHWHNECKYIVNRKYIYRWKGVITHLVNQLTQYGFYHKTQYFISHN